jgi:hypothetical protein
MFSFKSIFGKCDQDDEEMRNISEKVYELFKVPVCRLHVQKVEEKAHLCGLQPLRKNELSPCDLKTMSKEILLLAKQGDPVSG